MDIFLLNSTFLINDISFFYPDLVEYCLPNTIGTDPNLDQEEKYKFFMWIVFILYFAIMIKFFVIVFYFIFYTCTVQLYYYIARFCKYKSFSNFCICSHFFKYLWRNTKKIYT